MTPDTKAMLRVDQAGEYGATRIYAGQLAVMGTRSPAARAIAAMASQEERHRKTFDAMIARLDEVAGTPAPGLEVGHLLKRKREELVIHREDVDLITDYYGPDYARFGYAPPDRAAHPSDPYAALRGPFAHLLARRVVARQHARWVR